VEGGKRKEERGSTYKGREGRGSTSKGDRNGEKGRERERTKGRGKERPKKVKMSRINNGFWTDHGAGAHLRGAGADQRGRTALGAPVHAGVEAAPPGCSSCVVAQPYVLPSQWSRSPGM